MRTRDGAAHVFYAAQTRDCGCGCDGHVKIDGAKVYDAAFRALSAQRKTPSKRKK